MQSYIGYLSGEVAGIAGPDRSSLEPRPAARLAAKQHCRDLPLKIHRRKIGWSCSEWMRVILPYLHLHDHPYSKGSGWLWWMDKEAMTKKWGCQALSRCCDLSMPSRGQWTASRILKVSKSSARPSAKKNFSSTVTFCCEDDMTVSAGKKTLFSSVIKLKPNLSDSLCTEIRMAAQLVSKTKSLQTHLWICRYNVDWWQYNPLLISETGRPCRQAHSCLGQSMRSPFGQCLPSLTAYVADTARADVSLMKYK